MMLFSDIKQKGKKVKAAPKKRVKQEEQDAEDADVSGVAGDESVKEGDDKDDL